MALFLKDFDDDLRQQLRILALKRKTTLNKLIEALLRKSLESKHGKDVGKHRVTISGIEGG